MSRRFVFHLELGDIKVQQQLELEESVTPEAVQRIYEGWRDGHLVCAWWSEEASQMVDNMWLARQED